MPWAADYGLLYLSHQAAARAACLLRAGEPAAERNNHGQRGREPGEQGLSHHRQRGSRADPEVAASFSPGPRPSGKRVVTGQVHDPEARKSSGRSGSEPGPTVTRWICGDEAHPRSSCVSVRGSESRSVGPTARQGRAVGR